MRVGLLRRFRPSGFPRNGAGEIMLVPAAGFLFL
jgi:hypothetical protein